MTVETNNITNFQLSTNYVKKEILNRGKKSEGNRSIAIADKEIAKALLGGSYAYVSDDISTSLLRTMHMSASESCKIQSIPFPDGIHRMSPFVKRNSKIRRSIDYR